MCTLKIYSIINDSQLVVRFHYSFEVEEIFYDDEYGQKHCTRGSIKNGKMLATEN